MKKLLAFAMMFLLIGTLAACGGGDSEDQQAVDQAIGNLLIDQSMSDIRGNFNVPAQIQGLDVIWETDRDDLIDFGNVVDGAAYPELEVLVTRPEAGEGDQDITLTATIIKGDAEGTREFEGRVREQTESALYTDFADLYADIADGNLSNGDILTIEGIVVSSMSNGIYVWDGNLVFSVFRGDAEIGDEVSVTGELATWQTLRQISNVESLDVLSSGNDVDMSPETKTVEEIDALDLSGADRHLHGSQFVVRGRILDDDDDDWVLDSMDTDTRLLFTFNMFDEAEDILADYEGEVVDITIHINARVSDGVLIFFHQDHYTIEEVELDLEGQFDSDVDDVDGNVYLTDGDDIDLTTEGSNGTTFTDWTSDNTDLIDHDGTFVDRPEQSAEVTLTATATLGEYTQEVTVTVKVVGTESLSVEDALAYGDGEDVHVEGIVTAIDPFGDGIFMQDEDGPGIYVRLFSRDEDAFADVEVGNKITVFGTLARYTSWGNNERQVSGDKLLTSNDEGDHSVNIITDMSDEDIILGFNAYDDEGEANQPGGETNLVKYRLDNVTLYDEDFGDVKIGEDGYIIELGSDDDMERRLLIDLEQAEQFGLPSADDFEDGLELEYVEFVVQRFHFGNLRIVVTDAQVATD